MTNVLCARNIAFRIAVFSAFMICCTCQAQKDTTSLILTLNETSSGPSDGQKGSSCLNLYSDGKIFYSHRVTAAVGVEGSEGKITHPESRHGRVFKLPDSDTWQVSDFVRFLNSKPIRNLKPYFPPPHKAIDFFETSSVRVFFSSGRTKQIQVKEYYVSSLVERTKYPSALILLMDRIEQFENIVAEKGSPVDQAPDCEMKP